VAHGLDGNELLWFFTRGKTSSGRSNWREREREREREKEDGYLLLVLIVLLQTRICQEVIKEKLMIPCMAIENKEKHRM
jgi:hypothetical protein